MVLRCRHVLPAWVVALIPLGCGSSYHKVEGTVTLDGAPVQGATITFMPTFEGGQAASGVTDASGKFKLNNPGNEKGIPKGTYKVVITKSDPNEDKIDYDPNDPTKSMAEFAKKHAIKTGKGKSVAPSKQSNVLPPKYSKQDSTPLTITVPVQGSLDLKLEK